MLKPTFSTQIPTRAGFYLAWRKTFQARPEVVEICYFDKKLWYFGHISKFPLCQLEKGVLFSEAINFKGEN
jgi:hypothetical protein